ncbi:MAG: trypsin-like peptidase domain-containing protein, partial [Phycisphaerae bacterium]
RADTYIGRGSSNVTAPGDARQTALAEAVRDAVRKAIEKRLGPDAVLEHEGTIEDDILAEASSYVLRYTERDSRRRGTRLRVTIEAEVDDTRLAKVLTNLRLLQASVDMPRIMIVYDPEQRWDEAQARRVENQLIKQLTEKKYNVFETKRAREISALAQRALQFSKYSERRPMPGDELAQQLIARYECDAVVLYSVQESLQGMTAGFFTYETAVQAKIYTRDRAQYLAADEQVAAKPAGTEFQARLASAEAATGKVVDYLSKRTIAWWRDFRDLMPINLNLYLHRSHLGRVVALKNRIEGIVGVHSMNQRRMVSNPQDDSTWIEYQVNYRGRVDSFTEALWRVLEPEERDYKLLPMTFGNNITVQMIDPQQQQYDEAFWRKKLSERATGSGDISKVVNATINGAVVIRTFMDVPADALQQAAPAEKDQEGGKDKDQDNKGASGTEKDGTKNEKGEDPRVAKKGDKDGAAAQSQPAREGDRGNNTQAGGKDDESGRPRDGVRVKVQVEVETGLPGKPGRHSGQDRVKGGGSKEGAARKSVKRREDRSGSADAGTRESKNKPERVRRDGPKVRILESGSSGFIADASGLIITNHHVVIAKLEGVDGPGGRISPDDVHIVVTLHDGRKRPARIIRANQARDLAVLKIEIDGVQPMEMGDSDKVVVGQPIVVIGNPLDSYEYDFTVTNGIIAARRPAWLQITAQIHQGSSGSPVIDMNGRVIGVVAMGGSIQGSGPEGEPADIIQQGTGLCVPINDAKILLRSP